MITAFFSGLSIAGSPSPSPSCLLVAVLRAGAQPGDLADNPLHVPTYIMALFGKYLTYALLALALDLVWGFCGIPRSATAPSSRSAVMRWACI